MKLLAHSPTFAPTDLARFSENPYVTWMDRLHLEQPGRITPDADSEELKIIAGMGMDHERAFLAQLRGSGRQVRTIPDKGPLDERAQATESALRSGQDVIYQGALAAGPFAGLADFLLRVDEPSNLGSFSYEVWDTKLARKAKPYFLIQLCCYAEILESLQGRRPGRIVVVTGDGRERPFRTDDYFYYYASLRDAFLEQQRSFHPDLPPEPLREGKNGRWESEAARWLEDSDHLSRVADMRTDQIVKLRAAGIGTRQALGELARGTNVPRMRAETLEKLHHQARLQVASDGLDRPRYEVIPPRDEDPRRGLATLPPPSPLDVAFDIEGYPLVEGGLEYLLGATTLAEGAAGASGVPAGMDATTPGAARLTFHDWWAHNDAEEKHSFESFIDWIYARWQTDPTMHVYHYAAYEVTAMRRLMGKYGTREREVDDLLRHEVFVDLYRVVHQGVRIGAPSYSLKKVERLYLDARKEDVASAGESIVFYQRWLEKPDGADWQTSKTLKQIRDYNQVDCDSTWQLIEWLRAEQRQAGVEYLPPVAADGAKDAGTTEERDDACLARELLAMIPDGLRAGTESRGSDHADAENLGTGHADAEQWRVHELLAWLVEFHRREEKPTWWRMFDRREATEDQLRDDLDCLAGLERTDAPARPEKKSTAFEYRFDPDQDTKMRASGEGRKDPIVFFSHDLTRCTLISMDAEKGLLELKLGPKALGELGEAGPPRRLSLIPDEYVSGAVIAKSVFQIAERFRDGGKLPGALGDFLYRRRPRMEAGTTAAAADRSSGPLAAADETALAAALDIVPRLDHTTLCIQGPPGTGKTFTGAHVILKLLAANKKVGVTTNSHKAIGNLLAKVSEEAEKQGQTIDVLKVGGAKDDPILQLPGFRWTSRAGDLDGPSAIPPLVGGTAWAFSHENLRDTLDYLFVDEAGQVSVANLAGMSASARNLILLGDQMQLGQPTQGSHPGESGLSCLDYLLQDHATVPEDLGLFLGTTWRMHPDVCAFISGAVYEDRLQPEAHTANRRIKPPPGGRIDRESGMLFIPVEHQGNRQGSTEEVNAVADLIDELRRSRHTDRDGHDAGPLTPDDILIVAPYNLQVRRLRQRLGSEARVGTIDKFQGQEAPVVIISMAASSGEESPRGMDFLFDRNRLNVAISRAQSLAIVVASPGLARTPCGTVKQMGMVNMFCRAVGLGSATCTPP